MRKLPRTSRGKAKDRRSSKNVRTVAFMTFRPPTGAVILSRNRHCPYLPKPPSKTVCRNIINRPKRSLEQPPNYLHEQPKRSLEQPANNLSDQPPTTSRTTQMTSRAAQAISRTIRNYLHEQPPAAPPLIFISPSNLYI